MGRINTKKYLTFDDVLIKPAASALEPNQTKVETALARGFFVSIPIISAAMDRVTDAKMAIKIGKLGGLGILHRNNTLGEAVRMVKKVKKAGVLVGAACSPFDVKRAKALKKAGVDLIAIDSAHGHNRNVIKGAKEIKKSIGDTALLVGNVATKEAARELVTFADGIKVGIGSGSICTTRIVSGVGMPQLSAIMEVASVAKKHGVPVIADGGIRTSGDVAKAIAGGASAVMLGNIFAGTDAAPGKLVVVRKKRYKEYRGMGSRVVLEEGKSNDRYLGANKGTTPEGVVGLVPYCGKLSETVKMLVGGLQHSMGYVGAKDIEEFQRRAEFIQITRAGVTESRPHSLSDIKD